MNTGLSEILSLCLEPVANERDSAEILCSNQMLLEIDKINRDHNHEVGLDDTEHLETRTTSKLRNLESKPSTKTEQLIYETYIQFQSQTYNTNTRQCTG